MRQLLIGDRVLIIETRHPWKNHVGILRGADNTLVGKLYLVELDNGMSCYVHENGLRRLK